MSDDIKTFINVLNYHPGVMCLSQFYEEMHGETEQITIDTGVYDHLFYTDVASRTKENDIFMIHCPTYGFGDDQDACEDFMNSIQDYLAEAEKTGRTFFLHDIYKDETKGTNYWVMNYNS